MNLLDATTEFHTLAGLPTAEWEGYEALRSLRRKLLKEEVKEYLDAENEHDIVEIVDGLCDIIVIAWGTLLAYVGKEAAEAAATAVALSNLSKVDGTLGEIVRREDGKLLKPEGWEPPDIKGALGL